MKSKLAFLLLFLISINSLFAQITEMNPMPERVTNNAVVEGFVNGVPYVYSFAGLDSTKEYSGIHLRSFRYNTQADSWETIAPLPDTLGKIATSASRIGDIIYIIGGYHVFSNGTEISSNKVHRYDTQNNVYLTDGTPIPVPIDDQVQAVWRDSLIYVVTGWSNTQNVTNVQIYNPTTDEWAQGTPIPNENSYPSFGAAGLILNDTIYYFGGARNGNFASQIHMRKGIINGTNPTEISWESFPLSSSIKAYRPVAYKSYGESLFWVGGADNTYNYDGIAYNNGQGVEPNERVLYLNRYDNSYEEYFYDDIPMDLRGVASIGDTVHYLAGGMEGGQLVSNKTLKLTSFPLLTNTVELQTTKTKINLYPNPVGGKLNFKLTEISDCKDLIVQLYDLKGTKMKEIEIQNCHTEIDISDFPAGTYLLAIKIEDQIVSENFVKN